MKFSRWIEGALWLAVVLVCSWDFLPDVHRYLFDTRTSLGPVDDKTSELLVAQDDTLRHILSSLVQLGAQDLGNPGVTLSPLPFILVRIFTDLLGPFVGYNLLTALLWMLSGALTLRLVRTLQPQAPPWIQAAAGVTMMMAPWTQYTVRNGSVDFLLFPLLLVLIMGLIRVDQGKITHSRWLIGGSLIALSLSNFYYLLSGLVCLAIGVARWTRHWPSWSASERRELSLSTGLTLVIAALPCIAQLRIIEMVDTEARTTLLSQPFSTEGHISPQALGFGNAWGTLTSPIWLCALLLPLVMGTRQGRRSFSLLFWVFLFGLALPYLVLEGSSLSSPLPGLWRARRIEGFMAVPALVLVLGAALGWSQLIALQRRGVAVVWILGVLGLSAAYSARLMDETQSGPRVDAPQSVQDWAGHAQGAVLLPDNLPHTQILAAHLRYWSGNAHGVSFLSEELLTNPPSESTKCYFILAPPERTPPTWASDWPLVLDRDDWRAWSSQACTESARSPAPEAG